MKILLFFAVIWRLILQAWTTPKTWASEPLTSTDMNTHIRDNLDFLYGGWDESRQIQELVSSYSTTSLSFVDIDATNLSLDVTTTGGDVLVTFIGTGSNSGSGFWGLFNLSVNGTDVTTAWLTAADGNSNDQQNVSFTYIATGLSAGTHTFRMRYRASSGTTTLDGSYMAFIAREIAGTS